MNYELSGINGKQWGKLIYTSNISFAQITEICRIDPDVQREADTSRMEKIADYIFDGLLGKRFMAGFNAIVTSLRYSALQFDKDKKTIRISTRGKLFVSDGQHRIGGIERALQRIEFGMDKAREENDVELMEYWSNIMELFEEMTIPVVIFTDLTKDEEQQLFHDLNNLGASVTTTQALHLDQSDNFNKLAKQLAQEIPKIRKYGIETRAKQLSDKRKEVATLAVWNNCVRILLNGSSDSEMKKEWNLNWDFDKKAQEAQEFWETLLDILPEDYTDKEKHMITKSVYLQGLAAWGHKIIYEEKIPNWKSLIYELHDFDWSYQNHYYSEHGGGSLQEKKNKRTGEVKKRFYFKGTRAAINSIPSTLNDYVTRPATV